MIRIIVALLSVLAITGSAQASDELSHIEYTARLEADVAAPVEEYTARAAYEGDHRRLVLSDFSDGGTFSGGRKVRVQLPPGYHDTDERYRTLYLFDGWVFLSMNPNETTYKTLLDADLYHDQLMEEGVIHPAILVTIDNGWFKLREYELTPPLASGPSGKKGGLEENRRFLVERLKPYIDATFRTLPAAEHTGVAGRSFGGLAAFYLAYMHPDVFGLAGCMSVSFWWDDSHFQKKVLSDHGRSSSRFWIQDGTRDGWKRSYPVYRAMASRGWIEGDDLAYLLVYGGEHGQQVWNSQMKDMLHFLLRKQMPPLTGIQARRLDNDRYIMVDLNHEGGFRLNAGWPSFEVDDTTMVTIEDRGLFELQAKKPGQTSITAQYGGFRSQIEVPGDNRHWILRRLSSLSPW